MDSGTALTTDELAKQTGIDLTRLRVDLYHLETEGKIEKRPRGNVPAWSVKLGAIPEHNFARHRR